MNLKDFNQSIYDTRFGELPPSGSWPQPGWFGKNAFITFIGQNPGSPRIDEPFEHGRNQETYLNWMCLSPTGRLIKEAIEMSGLTWDDVAYTNIVKSPTPGNRGLTESEITYYKPRLVTQMNLLQPKKIILFGRFSSDNFPHEQMAFNYSHKNVYHPSYVLRIGKSVQYVQELNNFIKE